MSIGFPRRFDVCSVPSVHVVNPMIVVANSTTMIVVVRTDVIVLDERNRTLVASRTRGWLSCCCS
jgi:hypothetical protein